jgi:hypothetical protein
LWQESNGLDNFPTLENLLKPREIRVPDFQKNQTVSNEGIIATEKTIRDLAARMSDRIGIPVIFETDRTKNYKGKLDLGAAYVNLANATLDTPIHEILGHPIIRAIRDSYNERGENALYQNLLKELETGKGKEVLDRIKRDYSVKTERKFSGTTIDNKESRKEKGYEYEEVTDNTGTYFRKYTPTTYYTLEEQQEEAIVELLGLMTAGKLDAVSDGKLISLLKRLLKEMKAFVKSLLDQKEVEIDKLPDNMTLGDLSDLLAYSNSKLILPGYEVEYTTPDNMKFKTYQEASNHISQLAKSVKDVDLSDINVKNAYLNNESYEVPEGDEGFADPFGTMEYKTVNKNPLIDFINKNKEYEQSKEIIEEWKKVNNIQYNPEEIYSRGQEFSSVVGAYSSFDVNLMMQNLLQHIEDNKKAGGSFAISAYTKPVDKQIGHLEGGGGKIKFKMFPKSEDILWAANTDVYSGSVWDASEKVNKDKKSELLGVSYTKYPSLRNVNSIQPNLASIVDDLNHHHNELGIALTGNNFRLEYDEDIPYQTKKIIDSINSILDQKYGKLISPKLIENREVSYYEAFKEIENKLPDFIDTGYVKYKKENGEWYKLTSIDEFYNKEFIEFNLSEERSYNLKAILEVAKEQFNIIPTKYKNKVVQPTQTNETLKESIDIIRNEYLNIGYNDSYMHEDGSIYEPMPDDLYDEKPDFEEVYDENGEYLGLVEKKTSYQDKINRKFKQDYEKSQALINTKIAKLKEVAKKYPRSLIRSEVKRIDSSSQNLFPGDELPFQKVGSALLFNDEVEDYALPIRPTITNHSVYSPEEFNAFRNSYLTKEDLKLAADVVSEKLMDAVGYKAVSYQIKKSELGLIKRVIVNPTSKRDTTTAVNNNTYKLALRMSKIIHPSFIKGFLTIPRQVENEYDNEIKVQYNKDLLLAFAEGMQHKSLEQFQEYMYERFLESKGLLRNPIQTPQDAREELEHLKTMPHSQFQGFYDINSGQLYTTMEQWKAYMEEAAQYDENLEDYEDYALSVNNPNTSLIIDPTYEYYAIKRKEQITKLDNRINTLKSKERLEGTDTALTTRISYLKNLKEKLSKDLLDLKSSTNLFETVKTLLNRDTDLVKNLLNNPSLENFFLAEDIVDFIDLNLDYNNANSKLFRGEDKKSFEPKILDLLKEVRAENAILRSKINSKRADHFINILSKYENNIKDLYPGKTLEEIKDILLRNLQDISSLEDLFLSQGKNLVSESDVVGELMRLEYDIQVEKEKPRVQRLIKKINTLVPRVQAELKKLGHVTVVGKGVEGVTKFSFYNYQSLFYRKDDKGNIMPVLVSKFSQKWDRFIKNFNFEMDDKLFQARYDKDWTKVETLLREKYYKLNANVNFVDFTKLEDVANLTSDPKLKVLFSNNTSENATYKANLISEIGLPEYENIVKQQVSLLQSFLIKEGELVSAALAKEKKYAYVDLTDFAKQNIEISLKRYNPAAFLQSVQQGNQGLIEYTIGTQSNAKYAYLDFNTYYPKKDNYQNQSTDYYDKDYEVIENNPVLKEFWPVMEEALFLINDNLIDSNLKLDSKSILQMNKSMIENAVDRGFYESAKGLASKETLLNTVQHLKDTVSAKKTIKGKEKEVVLPNTINSFNNIVEDQFEFTRLEISNILETTLKNGTQLNWNTISTKNKEFIYRALGITNEQEFLDQVTLDSQGNFKVGALKIFDRIAVMEQQTADLPSLVKALLEQSVIHKARVMAKDSVDILRRISSENIKNREGKTEEEENQSARATGEVRTNAQKRNDNYYENVVLNESEQKHGGSLSSWKEQQAYEKKYANGELIDPEDIFKYLLNFHHKNFNPEEKLQYRVLKKRWDIIKNQLADPSITQEQKDELSKEKTSIEQRVTLMGKDYMATSIVSNLLNKALAIGIGLGYATLGMVYNYLNARSNFFHRDGEFWSEGNAYPAWAFVDMHVTRRINPEYRKQWKIMEAFVHQLDIVQDGTNELQKAKKTSLTESPKIYNLKRWAQNPLYGTELVEWYNQVPVMLAMGADIKITNPITGEIVPLFNGTGFPAHEIDEQTGQLKLKDEFRSPENIQDYENFDSDKMAIWKTQVNRAIQSLNGDYSVSGIIRAKSNVGGQTLMMFKTWAGEYYHSRWAIDQKSVAFGKTKDGFITGAFLNKETRGMATTMLVGNVTAGVLMTPMISYGIGMLALTAGAGFLISGGIAGALYYKNRKNIAQRMAQYTVPSVLSWQQTARYMIKASTIGTIETPVNKAWNMLRLVAGTATGKTPGPQTLFNIDSTFNGKLDQRTSTNLRNMTRMFQKSNTSLLIAILAQLFLGDDDDEETEAKGKEGSEQEERYIEQQERRKQKKFIFNTVKNINQREFDEMNLGHNVLSSLNMFVGDESTALSSVEGLAKLAVQVAIMSGDEKYNKPGSMYHGDDKSSVFARKALLPQAYRNIGKENWAGGFEIVGDQEYQKTDLIDKIFESDMKQDRRDKKVVRAEIKLKTQQEISVEEFGVDYNDLDIEEQLKVDREVTKELEKNEDYQFTDREDYDEDQNLIE